MPGSITLEGTPEEISRALRGMQDETGALTMESQSGAIASMNSAAEVQAGTPVWTAERVKRFWNWLDGDQKKLVRYLLDKSGPMTLPEVLKHLGRKQGNEIAGIRSCLSRNARRETGYKKAEVIEWAAARDGKWGYRLLPEVQELLKQIV